MNLARKLYELQSLDLEIQSLRDSIAQLNLQIADTAAIDKAKADIDTLKKLQVESSQKHRDLDFEVEDLQKNISKLNEKLYSGKVGNPKELMSIEQEADIFKNNLKLKEDELLDLMNEEETTQKNLKMQSDSLSKIEKERQQVVEDFTQKRDKEQSQLETIEKKRQEFVVSIDSQALNTYEGLRLRKKQAVVKIEQGRCQGCRISLPMNELQRARTGTVVQCSSCSKILYLE